MRTYYELLGVEPNADDSVVKAAFRKALKEHHPDLNSGDAASEQRSRKLIQAYNVLKNPKKRARYNRAILRGRTQHRPILLVLGLASVVILGIGSLLFRDLFQGAKHDASSPKAASHEVRVSKLSPPADSTAGPSYHPPEASEPGDIPQPVTHLVAWQAIEKTGTMAELWAYAKSYPNTLEGTLAELRLWRLIDTSQDRASLAALGSQAVGRVAERVRRRLEALMGETTPTMDLLPEQDAEATTADPASPLSDAPESSSLDQPTDEGAPVLPR